MIQIHEFHDMVRLRIQITKKIKGQDNIQKIFLSFICWGIGVYFKITSSYAAALNSI
jgi:hypothetical protein